MKHKIITPVAIEPITLAEAKLHCKADFTDDDTLISGLITSAREYCESATRRALATQTIEAYLDSFPVSGEIELPRPPLQAVTSAKYKDSSGAETTMTADTEYIVDIDSSIGRIALPYGKSWPSFVPFPVNAVKVRYVAGYTVLPKLIKQAMLIYIGYFYIHRDVAEPDGATERAIERQLRRYRVEGIR